MTTVSRSTSPAVPARTADAAPPKGDYAVKKGDTLWSIAKGLADQQNGGKASNAQIASALAALKESNPALCTPARGGGDRIFAGDAVTFPQADGKGWKSAAAGGGAQTPSDADKAAATQQMSDLKGQNDADNARRKDSLTQQLSAAASYCATHQVTPEQAGMVGDLLDQAQEAFPELLATPEAKALQALLAGQGAATAGGTGTPSATDAGAKTPAATSTASTTATNEDSAAPATKAALTAQVHELAQLLQGQPLTLQEAKLAAEALNLIAKDPVLSQSADAKAILADLQGFIAQARQQGGTTGTGATSTPATVTPPVKHEVTPGPLTTTMTVAKGQQNTQHILDTLPPALRNSPQGQELARQLALSIKRGDAN